MATSPTSQEKPVLPYTDHLLHLKSSLQSQVIALTEKIQEDTELLIEQIRSKNQQELARLTAEAVSLIDQLEEAAHGASPSLSKALQINPEACLAELTQRIDTQGFFVYKGIDPRDGPQVSVNLPNLPTMVTVDLRSDLNSSRASSMSTRTVKRSNSFTAFDANQESKWSCYIDHDRRKLVKVFGDKGMFQELPVNLPRNIGINGSICKMPGNWFLHIGGDVHPEQYIDKYFKITDEAIETVPISPFPSVQGHGCVYYLGHLYIFGGFRRSSPVNDSYRYNLTEDVWEPLAPMPEASGYVSCCVVGDVILVTGYNMGGVYAYLPAHNEYLDLLKLAVREYKIVFTAYTKAFVICGDTIYQAQTTALDNFEFATSTAKGLVALATPPCRLSQLMYFIVGKNELWQYYLKSNSIVRTLN